MRQLSPSLVLALLASLSLALEASAVVIVEIIDATGDGSKALDAPQHMAVDASGNLFVSGNGSHNVFEITPSGTIREIIDANGDGGGNGLSGPLGVAVDPDGNVYVAGNLSNNVFKITPGGAISQIIDAPATA